MENRRLSLFLKVAEVGSLSRAADRIRLAQPALSRQMRLLEEELGFPLFRRHRRGMELTREGEELRARVAGPIRQIDLAVEEIRCQSVEVGGNVVLGLPPTTGTVLAGHLARRVARDAPNMTLRVVEGYSGHLIDWLQRGEIDLALLYGPACDYNLSTEEMVLESLVLVGPSTSGLDPGTPVTFNDVATRPLILPSHPHGLRVIVDNAAKKKHCDLQVSVEADSFNLMKELVKSGLGFTILPVSAIAHEIAIDRLAYAPVVEPALTRQLALATQPGADIPRAAERLATFVREEIVNLVESGTWNVSLMFKPQSGGPSDASR